MYIIIPKSMALDGQILTIDKITWYHPCYYQLYTLPPKPTWRIMTQHKQSNTIKIHHNSNISFAQHHIALFTFSTKLFPPEVSQGPHPLNHNSEQPPPATLNPSTRASSIPKSRGAPFRVFSVNFRHPPVSLEKVL